MRMNLVEAAAEASEDLMENTWEELTVRRRDQGWPASRVLNNEIILVTCGSAFKNKGVQAMLDAVVEYLPAPTDVPGYRRSESQGWRLGTSVTPTMTSRSRSGVQDCYRPVRGQPDLLPRLLRCG